MKHEYKIIEEAVDPLLSKIEKNNITAEFTLQEMKGDQAYTEKTLKEFYAQKKLEDAKMKNIEEHHPFVLEMSEQDCFTVHMYQEAKAISKILDKKIPEFEEALAESRREFDEIVDVLGLEITTPEKAVDEAVAKIVDNG